MVCLPIRDPSCHAGFPKALPLSLLISHPDRAVVILLAADLEPHGEDVV